MIRNGLLGLALAAALIGTTHAQAAGKAALVKRGNYLVNTIMTCGNCHTPKGPKGAIHGKAFSGGLSWDEPPFKVTAPNITQDKDTGIGTWSDADIKKLLRTGMRPNGTPIAPIMPTGFYGIITERDMNAIVAYLRTLKPIKNKVPDPVYRFPAPRQIFPGSEKPYTEAMLKDKVKNGFYLATIGHCMECHTPLEKGQHDWAKTRHRRHGIPRSVGQVGVAQHHLRARPRASAPGPTRRSSAPSPPASPRTAAISSRRWASATTPR